MTNQFNQMSRTERRRVLVDAAKRALTETTAELRRLPGRGRSNVWAAEESGRIKRVAIRTTQDRWFAFPPMENGTKWKTLSDVDVVVVAAVDNRDDPKHVEVYRFDAGEVRKRFDESYAARTGAGQSEPDGYGMWVGLDVDRRGLPASVGSGLASVYPPIRTHLLAGAMDREPEVADETVKDEVPRSEPDTIAAVMNWARSRIATLSGLPEEAVKLDCRIEP